MQLEQEGTTVNQGHLFVVLNATMKDEGNGGEKKESDTDVAKAASQRVEIRAMPQTELRSEQKQHDASHGTEASDDRAYRLGNWTSSETLVLLEAKRTEQDMFSGARRSVLTADDKWKFVADYCRTRGVQRTKEQCHFRWDNILPEYRKVKDYEEQKPPGSASYFDQEISERKSRQLPTSMIQDVFHRIDAIMCNKPAKGGLGGLKREAREKKFTDAAVPSQPVDATREVVDAKEMIGYVNAGSRNGFNVGLAAGIREERGKNGCAMETIGRQLAVTGSTRRRKRRGVDRASGVKMGRYMYPELRNSSSTEEDATVLAGRSDGRPSVVYVHEESAPGIHPVRMDYRGMANGCQNRLTDRGSPSVAGDEKTESLEKGDERLGLRDCEKSAELLTYIEDRKDARHKELLALEREKLAAFKEASATVANALNNAVSIFSKVAEELLRHR